MKTKFQELLHTLQQKGWTNQDIDKLSEEAAKACFATFYTKAVVLLTKEDLDAVDLCNTEEQANQKIKELYTLRSGNNAEKEAEEFYNNFAIKFLEELNEP